MSADVAMRLTAEMLWIGLIVCAPLLGLTLLVGVFISIIQVVTQIQEMSLAFIPKLLTAVAVLIAFGPWMIRRLSAYATSLITSIPSLLN